MNLVQDVVGLLEERKIGGRNLFMNNGLINKLTFPKKTFKYWLIINDSNINHTVHCTLGVKVRNLKMDFNTGGTLRQVKQ